jgi:hypothetical protein
MHPFDRDMKGRVSEFFLNGAVLKDRVLSIIFSAVEYKLQVGT